jgi:mannosyltransferase OCH1-like enzyme
MSLATGKRVPALIHQVWLDRQDLDGKPPARFMKNIDSAKALNPGYQHKVWSFRDGLALFDHPELARWKTFFRDTLKLHIEKCDFLRYAILLRHGGVYMDVDTVLTVPLDSINMQNRTFLWVRDHEYWTHHTKYIGEKPIYNGFLASAKGHPILRDLLDFIMFTYEPDGLVMCSTGPVAIGRFSRIMGLQKDPSIWGDRCWILATDAYGRKDSACNGKGRLVQSQGSFLESSWMLGGIVPWTRSVVRDHHLVIIFSLVFVLVLRS